MLRVGQLFPRHSALPHLQGCPLLYEGHSSAQTHKIGASFKTSPCYIILKLFPPPSSSGLAKLLALCTEVAPLHTSTASCSPSLNNSSNHPNLPALSCMLLCRATKTIGGTDFPIEILGGADRGKILMPAKPWVKRSTLSTAFLVLATG